MLLAGPNHQKETEHQIRVTGIGDSKAIASFAGTNRLVVAGKEAWFSIAGELRKLDREIYLDAVQRINQALASVPKDQKPSDEIQSIIEEAKSSQAAAWQWAIPCGVPLEMVKAGDALILGFAGEVRAYSSQSGELLWSQPMDGAAFGLAVAGGRLFVSTDEGDIHAFGRRQ
jgi:outer membrane protein assembly factor BamB